MKALDISFCLQCSGISRVRQWAGDRWNAYFCGPCNSERARNNGRSKAAAILAKEIREGRLPKAAKFVCTDCKRPATEYDHRDYSKPLDVEPVCRRCNSRRGPGKWTRYEPHPMHAKRALEHESKCAA